MHVGAQTRAHRLRTEGASSRRTNDLLFPILRGSSDEVVALANYFIGAPPEGDAAILWRHIFYDKMLEPVLKNRLET